MSAAGRRAVGYYNSGTFASPTWVEFKRISDVKLPRSRSTSDRMFRGAKNKKKVAGYLDFGVTFKYHIKKAGSTDTVAAKLQDSFINETVLDCIWVDQPLIAPVGSSLIGTSSNGFRGPYFVSKFDRDEADEDGMTYDVELSEADDEQSGNVFETIAFTATVA